MIHESFPQLATPLKLDRSKGIDKIRLATSERAPGTRLTVSGWGTIKVDFYHNQFV